MRGRTTLTILGALTAAVVAVFLFTDLTGNTAFILERRLTTVATMVVVATAIAICTVLFHAITGNQILTPSVMGFDSLFVLLQTVAAITIGVRWMTATGPVLGFAIETAVMLVVTLPAARWLLLGGRRSIEVVVLIGVVAGGLFRSVGMFLQRIMDPTQFIVLQDRFFARFTGTEPALIATGAVVVALGVVWVVRHHAALDVMALGVPVATTLGVDHRRLSTAALTVVIVLVSTSTALVGPTTFLGLLVAHLAYRAAGTHRHAVTVPAATLVAVITLVGGQLVLERVLGFSGSLSIVVEFAGGLVFLLLFLRRGAR